MYRNSLGHKEHSLNISLFKPEPNASIWGCITGKNKWSDFLKPQINGQSYKVDLNLQTVEEDKTATSTRKRKSYTRQLLLESREKKMLHKEFANENEKSGTNIYVKNLISNSTFENNLSNKRTRMPNWQKEANKGSHSVCKLKTLKSDGCPPMQLKFRDNVLHLYNVKGMKHKKVILQGVPTANIFPNLIQHNKRPIYLNPLKTSKSKSIRHIEDFAKKSKKQPSTEIKTNAEEQLVIPQLISKIKSMEQQIQCLESTTKKIDEEVMSVKSISMAQSLETNQNVPLKKKSIVMISYRRSHVLPIKKTLPFFRKRLKEKKLLKKGFSKTVTKMKNNDNFRDYKTKNKSKFNMNNTKNDYGLNFYHSREQCDMLVENLKLLLKNKIKERSLTPVSLKLNPMSTNDYNKYNNNISEINLPALLETDLNSNKGDLNSDIPIKHDETEVVLESENLMINEEQSLKINRFSHTTRDYSHLNNPETNYINILTSTIELSKAHVKAKPQELPTKNKVDTFIGQNQCLNYSRTKQSSMESCFDSQRNCFNKNETLLPIDKPNSYETEFINGKCGKESISLLNKSVHDTIPAKDNDPNCHQIEEYYKEISIPDPKFNITIFINEKDNISQNAKLLGKYENVSLIENHMYNTEMPSKVDSLARNYQTCKNIPIEEQIKKACYKPVSCPGELDKVKIRNQSLNSYDEFNNNTNLPLIIAKSDNHIQGPVNKPYLSKKQRKAIQNHNDKNQQIRFQMSDSLKRHNTAYIRKERNNQGDTFLNLKTCQTNIDKSIENEPFYFDKNITNLDFENNPINKFYNVTDNDYRFGDTGRYLDHMNVMKCFQTSVGKTLSHVNKPFSSYNEMHMKNFVHKIEEDQNNLYCRENILSNIMPLRFTENNLPVIKTRKFKTNLDNSNGKYNIFTKAIDYENSANINKHKTKVNVSCEDLKNASICQQFMKHAGQKLNEYAKKKWNENEKCNFKVISSIIGDNEKIEENVECKNTFNNTKTTYDCTLSNSLLVGKEDQSDCLENNKKKNTIKIQFSRFVDKRKTKEKNHIDECKEEFGNCIAYENLKDLSLPIKKCEALIQINNNERNELENYFSSLTSTHTRNDKSNGVDSGYESSKNKHDEIFDEIVTCIREMTINRMVDKGKNKESNSTPFNVNLEVKEEVDTKNEFVPKSKMNFEVKNQTNLREFQVPDYSNSTDEELLSKKKCEHCLNCQEKLSKSSKIINSNSENSVTEKCFPLPNIQPDGQNKSDGENSTDDKCSLKNDNDVSNLNTSILILRSHNDFKSEEIRSAEQNIPISKILHDKTCYNFPNISSSNKFVSKKEDHFNTSNKRKSNGSILKPLVVSSSNLFLDNVTKIKSNSSLQLKNNSSDIVNFYNLKYVKNTSIFQDNNGENLDSFQRNNLNAIVTTPSNNGISCALKSPPNMFNSFKVYASTEKDQLNPNFNLEQFSTHEEISDPGFRKKCNSALMTEKDNISNPDLISQSMQAKQFNHAIKCVSSSSVLKSNTIKNKSDLQLSYSDSTVCFPKISSSSSSNSTVVSNEYIFDNTLFTFSTQAKILLKELKQKIDNDSCELSTDQRQMLIYFYNKARECHKLSSEFINYRNKECTSISDIDNHISHGK